MKYTIRTLALLLLAVFAWQNQTPSNAWANKKTRVAKRAKRAANRHFKNGIKLYHKRKYTEALAEFERAYSLAPHPLVLYNLAAAHRELSQYEQSVHHFQRFLEEGKGEVPKARLQQAQTELDEILKLVATVLISTDKEGAKISLDGRMLGDDYEGPAIVGAGDHVVEARLDSSFARREFRVAAGDTLEIALELAEPVVAQEKPKPVVLKKTPVVVKAKRRDSKIQIAAQFVFTLDRFGDTGVPALGIGYSLWPRVAFGVDLTFLSYALAPNVRIQLAGDSVSLHAIAALPIALEGETQVAGAGGFGLRAKIASDWFARAELWLAFSEEATWPVSLAIEKRF